MIAVCLSIVTSTFSGILLYLFKKYIKKAEQEQQDAREREKLTLDFMGAVWSVTKETVACTLHNKKPNGDLDEAFKYMQEIKRALEEYLRKRAAR